MARNASAVAPGASRSPLPPPVFQQITIDQVGTSKLNPRQRFDPARITELAESIRAAGGILEPLIVRPVDDRFEIVAGERRYRAALEAGLVQLPCLVRELSDAQATELALIENTNRVDVHPVDEARAYQKLQKLDRKFYTVANIAARVGLSESHIYRRLKLFELEPELLRALDEDRLSIAHAEKLMRLPLPLQKEAADLKGRGVVWSRSPLLDWNEKWTPSRDDLKPPADLEDFIRNRSRFDPTSTDTKHFQPALAQAIEQSAPEPGSTIDEESGEAEDLREAAIVELSEDPMARVKLRAKPNSPIPLTPSKWREVKTPGQRCEFTRRCVITHGGAPRFLEACTAKTKCQKHFPASKAKRTGSASGAARRQTWQEQQAEQHARWERENKKRQEEAAAWEKLLPAVVPAFVEHLKGQKLKFGASLVSYVLSNPYDLHRANRVKKEFDVDLTDATATLVLALATVDVGSRKEFEKTTKAFKFNLGKLEQQLAKDAKAAAKKGKK
jgi:ParB/RepB/Spo0J family partition protein